MYKFSQASMAQQKIYIFMIVPPIAGYILIPLGYSIWEKIYYKWYEMGNNGLYIPEQA